MADRYFLVAVDYRAGHLLAAEVGEEAALVPRVDGLDSVFACPMDTTPAGLAQAAAFALRAIMPEEVDGLGLAPNGLPWGDVPYDAPDDGRTVAGSE